MITELKRRNIGLIVLAGFLWLVPSQFVETFTIINIHPALLPHYGGKGMYGAAVHESIVKNKETESGITIHLVNNEYDKGVNLLQVKCPVFPEDTPDTLAKRIHELEYQYFPKAIEEYLNQIIYK
jgi:phosphoribosylglycinamide formyltransferase-1